MIANNKEELERMLMNSIQKAMDVSSAKMLKDMREETEGFYDGSQPVMYERTGALGDTPKVTAVTVNGNEAYYDAYLDENHRYTTGKSPTMHDVLELANYGNTESSVGHLRPTVGRMGFWDRALIRMDVTFKSTFKKFFK